MKNAIFRFYLKKYIEQDNVKMNSKYLTGKYQRMTKIFPHFPEKSKLKYDDNMYTMNST